MGQRGFAMWDGVGLVSFQDSPEQDRQEPTPATGPTPEPPPPSAEEEAKEGVWKEDYEEMIEPEEKPAPPKPKKNRHLVGITIVVVIVIFLVLWTVLSPKVMPVSGTTYVLSPTYANLGNFTGVRSIWAGTTTWGVSVAGSDEVHTGDVSEYRVLITKVSESTGNFFFRGTSIVLTNVSLYTSDGKFVASMVSKSDTGYGKEALIKHTYTQAGNYSLYVTAKFTVYEVMRIGYIPLESVFVQKVSLENVEVTPGGEIAPI